MATFPITIDGSALFNKMLILRDKDDTTIPPSYSLDWFHTYKPIVFNLPSGDYHFFSTGGKPDISFTVTNAGTIDYPANIAHLLDGNGTSQLTLLGCEVTIDARYLLGAGVLFDSDTAVEEDNYKGSTFIRYGKVRLLPAPNYTVTNGSGVQGGFSFALDTNGYFHFDHSCHHFLKGNETTTIIFRGFPLLVDATAMSHTDVLFINSIWYNDTDKLGDSVPISNHQVILGNLLPLRNAIGDRYGLMLGNPNYFFSVDLEGNFNIYGSSYLKLDKFHGLTRIKALP